jgi:cytochrome c oxidase subunit 2
LSTIILVVLVIGVPGVVIGTFQAIDTISSPPEGTLKISVIGQRFAWSFVYPNGFQDSILRVPIGEVVILNVTSTDVFHNFGIIDFRIKIDAIPGRVNTIWFEAKEPGEYRIQCFEFCGVGHFTMISTVIVMEPEEYHRWYSSLEVKT